MTESAMEIKNREILFSLAWNKKIPAYYDLDGNKTYLELGKLNEDTYIDLSLVSDKPGMERIGIDRIWLWMICPVCNTDCFGFIIADDIEEVTYFMKNFRFIKHNGNNNGMSLFDYIPKVARIKDIFPMYKEWIGGIL